MRLDELKKISDSIDSIYCKCIKKVIAASMQYKYGENAFQELVRIDKEKQKKDKAEDKNYPLITAHINSFDEFDVQACTKTLLYLDEVENIIVEYYNLNDKFDNENIKRKYKAALRDLIATRNNKSHNNIDEQVLSTGIDSMWFIIKNLFSDIQDHDDPQKRTFLSQLSIKRADYYNELERTKYYFKDKFDSEKYDGNSFLNACARSGIEAKMEDGEYVFYSSDLARDTEIIKNNLVKLEPNSNSKASATAAVSKHVQPTPTPVVNRQSVQPTPTPVVNRQPVQPTPPFQQVQTQAVSNHKANSKKKRNAALIICTVLLLLIILLFIIIGKSLAKSNPDSFFGTVFKTSSSLQEEHSEAECEIPKKYKAEMDIIEQHGDDLLQEIVIEVGEKKSVDEIDEIKWSDAYVYSGNTGIARIFDGNTIEGVKVSEDYTYILVEAGQGSVIHEVYKLYVTEPATTNQTTQNTTSTTQKATTATTTTQATTAATIAAKGKNEIPAEYKSEIENFKYQDEGFINLKTIEISIGEKKSTMAASTWGSGTTTYSQNTAIAKIDSDGLIVGVGSGETYVLVKSSTGTTVVYKVVVS